MSLSFKLVFSKHVIFCYFQIVYNNFKLFYSNQWPTLRVIVILRNCIQFFSFINFVPILGTIHLSKLLNYKNNYLSVLILIFKIFLFE